MKQRTRLWRSAFICFTVFLFVVFLLAYTATIPTTLIAFPRYDSVGHFALYGIWAYLAARAFDTQWHTVPAGVIAVAMAALADESLQLFSSLRTFDLNDVLYGLGGIAVAWMIWRLSRRANLHISKNTL